MIRRHGSVHFNVALTGRGMQTISTLLSEHVMANYDSFAAGVDDVQRVDEQLQVR